MFSEQSVEEGEKMSLMQPIPNDIAQDILLDASEGRPFTDFDCKEVKLLLCECVNDTCTHSPLLPLHCHSLNNCLVLSLSRIKQHVR